MEDKCIMNRLIIYSYKYKVLKPLKYFLRFLLHIELPDDIYKSNPCLPHPYNIIIGAGAVVVKDVEQNSIVVGNPAHKIGEI